MAQGAAEQLTKAKVIFLGDFQVGRTSIINRCMYNTFTEVSQPTIGIDFLSKTVHVDNRTIRLQLWDIGSRGKRFRGLLPSYIRDCAAAVVVYDVTNHQSFEHVESWVQDVRNERGSAAAIWLVGNKIEAEFSRKVSFQAATMKSLQLGVSFMEVSAETGDHINELVQAVAQGVFDMKITELAPNSSSEVTAVQTSSSHGEQLTKGKFVFLGYAQAGKTAIINRYVYNTFTDTYQPTYCLDFLSKTVHVSSRTIRLQLWDAGRQDRFRSVIPSCIRDCAAAVVVYDVTNRKSFEAIDSLVRDVRPERGREAVIMLVGNKIEAQFAREVSFEEATMKSLQLGVSFMEVSAKTGDHINELVQAVTQAVFGVKIA